MTKKELVMSLYKQQFNCCQAIFAAYRQEDKLDKETALKMASVFGAGVASSGHHLCGAALGALMAISMKHGVGEVSHYTETIKVNKMGRQFLDDFREKNSAYTCEEILGINIGTRENAQKAQEMNLFETRCLKVVMSAADILEKML